MTSNTSRWLAKAVIATSLGLAAGVALAQESIKVGFVNTDRVMREANVSKASQAKLEAEFGKREKEMIDQGEKLRQAVEKFEREAPTLSEANRTARQRALTEQDRDFQRKRREFQEDLNQRKNEELQGVLERANRAVKQIAEAEKYDVIFQDAVYMNPKHDITDRVLRALNQ
jgi:outer membrane protein